MTDKVVGKKKPMENSDNTNYTGDISCSSKESDTENVDAIKKYIEEQQQEILLKQVTSGNDLDTTIHNHTSSAEDKVIDCELLQQQLTHIQDSNISTDIIEKQKEKMVLSPSNNKSVLNDFGDIKKPSEEKKIPSQIFVNNYISQVENEENLLNKLKASNPPQHQNFIEQNLSENQFPLTVQESVHETVADIFPELNEQDGKEAHKDLSEVTNSGCETKFSEIRTVGKNKNINVSKQQLKNNLECLETKEICNLLKSSKDHEADTLENGFCRESDSNEAPRLLHQLLTATNTLENEIKMTEQLRRENKNTKPSEESLAIASSVMDMILSDAETVISKKKGRNVLSKQMLSPEKVNISSVSLAIGSKVEAKDFSETWYPAQIIEVDCDEMEVLVEYDEQPKKSNEWISISSPRLRPLTGGMPKAVLPSTASPVNFEESISEQKVEEKQKLTFAVGERCLARWRDNRRFIATVQNYLDNGNYEVMFDDGFVWKCPLPRLYKLKESCKNEFPNLSDGAAAPAPAPASAPAPAPLAACAPSTAPAPPAAPAHAPNGLRVPIFHTHLFDPTRDYLGSKSERREMKRKLNIKEIFNIGQKRKKIREEKSSISNMQPAEVTSEIHNETAPLASNVPPETTCNLELNHLKKKKSVVRKRPFMRKKIKLKIKTANDIPEAVASIIGTSCESETPTKEDQTEITSAETKDSNANDIKHEDITLEEIPIETDSIQTSSEPNTSELASEIKTEPDTEANVKHEEAIDKIKEVITKLEDGIKEEKEHIKAVTDELKDEPKLIVKEKRKKSSKVKKSKKLKLLQEKKVKKEVAKVKCQLEAMKRQVEAMRQQILLKAEQLEGARAGGLLPGEWACRWRDGQPEGPVSELPCEPRADLPPPLKPPLPRRSVQVEDYRLPPGWTKHMVRRSFGHSAGKWDVVLVNPDNRRFHTKNDMRVYLENKQDDALKPFEAALLDFGVHLKLARRLGWWVSGGGGVEPAAHAAPPAAHSPLLPRRPPRPPRPPSHHTRELKVNIARIPTSEKSNPAPKATDGDAHRPALEEDAPLDGASIKDGFVHVGSLKVQVIETLLRCPADGCFKNFRNTTLLKMHIKHYHRDLRKMMGVTPKVLDLAYARTRPSEAEMKRLKCEARSRIIKVKLPRLHRRAEEQKAPEPAAAPEPGSPAPAPASPPPAAPAPAPAPAPAAPATPPPLSPGAKPLDSPKLRNALAPKPTKRPRVLLPVRRPESEPEAVESSELAESGIKAEVESETDAETDVEQERGWAGSPECALLDFEAAISSHRVGRAAGAAGAAGWGSEPDDSSHSGTLADDDLLLALSSDSTDDKHNVYMFTENGERIKLVRMKREEIINCHCGFREEDGLMVQCELCLCWQHALCHNITREADVPEKYTCSICLNPRRGRRRQRFTHDQDRLYEGLLPSGGGAGGAGGAGGGARAQEPLRRAHELAGNLLRAADALHAVRVNAHVATKRNHPKLYLWAKDWETVELAFAQEKLNSEYSDLSIIINNLGKENLPIKAEGIKLAPKTPSEVRPEKVMKKGNQNESPSLLPGIMSSPSSISLDLPISESEIEKLAKSVQVAAEAARRAAPQPEAPIEDGACRARLLRHVQRCYALLDQKLDSIEAQVAELESQDPSLEDDESAEFCPRTKQTVAMLLRDLDTMEELGILT